MGQGHFDSLCYSIQAKLGSMVMSVRSVLGLCRWRFQNILKFEECVDVEKEEFGSGGEKGGLSRLSE